MYIIIFQSEPYIHDFLVGAMLKPLPSQCRSEHTQVSNCIEFYFSSMKRLDDRITRARNSKLFVHSC